MTGPQGIGPLAPLLRSPFILGSWAYSGGSGANPPSTLLWPVEPEVDDVAVMFITTSNDRTFRGTDCPTLPDFGAPLHQAELGAVYARLCDGSEDPSYNVVVGGSAQHVSIIIVLPGLGAMNDRGWAQKTPIISSGNIVYPSITPSASPTRVFYVAHGAVGNSGTPVNPGGSNPSPVLLTDSGVPPFPPSTRSVIWTGLCTSTGALGDRSVSAAGVDSNYYQGQAFALGV